MTQPTITLSELQAAAWANKLAKGFDTTNVHQEFNLLNVEQGEAYTAWRHGDQPSLAGELADVAIFLAGIAQMTGVDLEKAVIDKLAVNAQRTYVRAPNGVLVKSPTDAPDTH